METNNILNARIEREKQKMDYYCPPTDRTLLQKMMQEINIKFGTNIEYIAQIDYYNIHGAGLIYSKYLDLFTSESVRAYLIPQIASDKAADCEEKIINSYFRFKNSKDYISGQGKPAPAYIYVRYDNAIKQIKPKKSTNILLELAENPRDAFYLPLTMRMLASWRIPKMEGVLLKYLKTDNTTAEMISLPEHHEGYYPALTFVRRELLFTAIYGLRYYINEENKSEIQAYVSSGDRDISEAAQKTIAYYRKH